MGGWPEPWLHLSSTRPVGYSVHALLGRSSARTVQTNSLPGELAHHDGLERALP